VTQLWSRVTQRNPEPHFIKDPKKSAWAIRGEGTALSPLILDLLPARCCQGQKEPFYLRVFWGRLGLGFPAARGSP
jgi:hypothetical protein